MAHTAAVRILVLGASGLIGRSLAESLSRDGADVTAVARRFTDAQAAALSTRVTCPIVDLDAGALASLLAEHRPDIILNCLGVLQDSLRGTTRAVHVAFVSRLLQAIQAHDCRSLLVHVSIPGRPEDDGTAFSRTKREAEDLIKRSRCRFAILRPGFVIAPGAYGGSALMRALALVAVGLPTALLSSPFATTSIDDLAKTVSHVADRWKGGERDWSAVWDVVADEPSTVGGVLEAFRRRFGGPKPRLRIPVWAMRLGALAGDAVAVLGWSPPTRTTALHEMIRGVEGDPRLWIAESGIAPTALSRTISDLPSTVQEQWFGRLYCLKPLILVCLAIFWIASGLIALLFSFEPATAILTAHGIPETLGRIITIVSSLADISVGVALSFRRSCRTGLRAGIAVSLFYMISAALITPELWTEPLGALVKTGPAIVLMLVALAVLDAR